MQAGIAQLLAWKAAAIGLWFVLLFVLERARPAAAPRLAEPGWRRLSRNAALWAGNALLSPLVVVPVSAFAAGLAPQWRPA